MVFTKRDKPILVTRSALPDFNAYTEEIRSIWDNHWLTNMGPKHEQLRAELKDYMQVPYVELLTNGHMALELVLEALDLKGEVITTPFTYISTTHSIVRNGLTPVFCDIRPDDYTMDPEKIEALITDKTCAIMPVHVYGNVCDVERIQEIADKHHLKVIYDAAHTFGETYKGKGIGTFGDANCFSFHATKVFNTVEGGAVTTADPAIAQRVSELKNFGYSTGDEIPHTGSNAKMNEFCAAMGLCLLREIETLIEKRKKICARYDERLAKVRGIKLNAVQKDVSSNYAYYPVEIIEEDYGMDRDALVVKLNEYNIFPRKYFYPITSAFEVFKGIYDPKDTPIAYRAGNRVITLPLHAELPLEDVDFICDLIEHFAAH